MADKQSDLRIVLLGKTGSGKSAAGNTILSSDVFTVKQSLESITVSCEKQEADVNGRVISVIDCPGLFDTTCSNQKLLTLLEECICLSCPGPHVFLLVMKLGVKFTEEEKNVVKWIQKNFGEDAVNYTIILFTHTDVLKGKPLEEYLSKSKDLKQVIKACWGRYLSFNNENIHNRDQVTLLLQMIDKMVIFNGGNHYNNDMYLKAQEKMKMLKDAGKKAAVGGYR